MPIASRNISFANRVLSLMESVCEHGQSKKLCLRGEGSGCHQCTSSIPLATNHISFALNRNLRMLPEKNSRVELTVPNDCDHLLDNMSLCASACPSQEAHLQKRNLLQKSLVFVTLKLIIAGLNFPLCNRFAQIFGYPCLAEMC